MSVPWPRCGDETPHRPHQAPTGHDCPGWTAEQQLVRSLFNGVREYLYEHYGPASAYPPGLRLEMHPWTRRVLMLDPDLWERPGRERALEDFFPVPVRVSNDLEQGAWRLVIVTEEVLLCSTASPGPRPG